MFAASPAMNGKETKYHQHRACHRSHCDQPAYPKRLETFQQRCHASEPTFTRRPSAAGSLWRGPVTKLLTTRQNLPTRYQLPTEVTLLNGVVNAPTCSETTPFAALTPVAVPVTVTGRAVAAALELPPVTVAV